MAVVCSFGGRSLFPFQPTLSIGIVILRMDAYILSVYLVVILQPTWCHRTENDASIDSWGTAFFEKDRDESAYNHNYFDYICML